MVRRLPGEKRLFFPNHFRLQIKALKIFNQDNMESIIARSFKLCELIEDDE